MEKKNTIELSFSNLSEKFPAIITRKKIEELTGGLISAKSLANLDCEGSGITPRLRIGGKVAYPKDAAILWLKARCNIDQ